MHIYDLIPYYDFKLIRTHTYFRLIISTPHGGGPGKHPAAKFGGGAPPQRCCGGMGPVICIRFARPQTPAHYRTPRPPPWGGVGLAFGGTGAA